MGSAEFWVNNHAVPILYQVVHGLQDFCNSLWAASPWNVAEPQTLFPPEDFNSGPLWRTLRVKVHVLRVAFEFSVWHIYALVPPPLCMQVKLWLYWTLNMSQAPVGLVTRCAEAVS